MPRARRGSCCRRRSCRHRTLGRPSYLLRPGESRAGRRVEVYSDDKWFRAKVVTTHGTLTRVHFVDFDDSYDEWVRPEKIRAYQPPQYAEGDKVFARWHNDDEWFPATVRQSFDGMSLVHYEVDDDEMEDEWLDRRAVRLRLP